MTSLKPPRRLRAKGDETPAETRRRYAAKLAVLGWPLFTLRRAAVTRLQDAIKVDFHCHVCGAETSIAPNLPDRAVCPEHCPDHMYEYERGEQKHYCGNCGQEPPLDWYSED